MSKRFPFFFFFYNELQVSNYLVFLCLTDKTQVNPRISLINVPALNYLLRSQIFVNDDGQLRAAHLILDYEPLSRSFLDVGNAIKANDYSLARIDVSWPHFLAPHDLPPVDHPIPGRSLGRPANSASASWTSCSRGRNCIFLFAWGRNWQVPIWRGRNTRSRSHCYIRGQGRNRRVLVHLNPCSYSHLRGGFFRQRSWKNGFKIWQKFERAYEGEEHSAYPSRNP